MSLVRKFPSNLINVTQISSIKPQKKENMRIVALLISLINFAISVVFFCFPIAYVAKWIWRGLLQKDNRNANMAPPNYDQADVLRSRERFQLHATESAREAELRRRQRQAEYQQRFASEWLEESRVIEESLRFREEEELQRRLLTQQNNNNNNVHDDSRAIIAEQNAAFEESLKQDREKEEKRVKEENERKMAEEERQILEESMRNYRDQLKESLSPEPDPSTQNAVEIALRFPDGTKQIRRFLKSTSSEELFNFIEGSLNLETRSWQLFTSYPKTKVMASKVPDYKSKNIEDLLGGAKKHLLIVEEEFDASVN
jgi:flagellar biosynthesis GTPase FlhF